MTISAAAAPFLVEGATPTRLTSPRLPVDTSADAPVLDVTIPVYNEEIDLENCVRRLHGYLTHYFAYSFAITIADNASTDSTLVVAERLARELPAVRVVHLDQKGRGNALRTVWMDSSSPVLAYMDVDLSTDLAALAPLVAPLMSGHSDVAIGTRLSRESRVMRGPKREFISRCYNLLLHSLMAARFSDAQCGFKAIRADVAAKLLPHTTDTAWFFDTELLVLAERCGLRVHEVPVDWTDDPDSTVDIVPTALADLRGMWRLGQDLVNGKIPVADLRTALSRSASAAGDEASPASRRNLLGQLVRFGAVGVASTLAYLLIFLLGRSFLDAQLANFIALLITAVGNTAANRRFTFGIQGATGAAKHHLEGLIVFGIGLALTSVSLLLAHSAGTPTRGMEVLLVTAANLLAALVRFLLFRLWVFRPGRRGRPRPSSSTADSRTADSRAADSSAQKVS